MNTQSSGTKVAVREQTSVSSTNSMHIDGYLQRAQKFADMQKYARAIFELRQAIKEYPNNPVCHSTISVLYWQTNQKTMAGVHAKRTLALDPSNQLATKIQQKLTKQKAKPAKGRSTQTSPQKNGIFGLLSTKMF
ncbi:MAG: hypothetical protein AAF821_21455 [Cyanobacteria bacterium P01_D01_bin.156]